MVATGDNNARGINCEGPGLLPGPQGWLMDPVPSLDVHQASRAGHCHLAHVTTEGPGGSQALSSTLPLPQGAPGLEPAACCFGQWAIIPPSSPDGTPLLSYPGWGGSLARELLP